MNDDWEARLLAQGVAPELIAAARATAAGMAQITHELTGQAADALDPVQFYLELQKLARMTHD